MTRDIDDEFAFHIAHLEAELRANGHSEESARQEARHRFGNEAAWRSQCRTLAMKERMMLQKVNVAMTIVLFVAVAVLSVVLFNSNHRNAVLTDSLMTQIEALQQNRTTVASKSWATDPSAGTRTGPGVVYVEGEIARPGTYNLPTNGMLTLSRLVAASGGSLASGDDKLHVTVRRFDEARTTQAVVCDVTLADLRNDPSRDMKVVADDYIRVASVE